MDFFNDSKLLLYIITLISVSINIVFAYLSTRYAYQSHAKTENKSKLLEWASAAALEDFKQDRTHQSDSVQSMTSYIAFYYSFFNSLEENGQISEKEFILLQKYSDKISYIASEFRDIRAEEYLSGKNKLKLLRKELS
jgi:hypothetical protein